MLLKVSDIEFELDPFEEDGSVLIAAESSWRGMADELQELYYPEGCPVYQATEINHLLW